MENNRAQILIIDRLEEMRSVVEGFLRKRGYSALSVQSVESALPLIREHAPAVVITNGNTDLSSDAPQPDLISDFDTHLKVVLMSDTEDDRKYCEPCKELFFSVHVNKSLGDSEQGMILQKMLLPC